MTFRERFNAVMDFQPVDRALFVPYMGASESTWNRWKTEGLGEQHWAQPFGFDVRNEHAAQFAFVPVNHFVYPPFEIETLEHDDKGRLIRDERGVTKYLNPECPDMVHFVNYPVSDRAGWEIFKSRLDPHTPGRLPANFEALSREYRQRDYVLGIGGSPMGLFSGIRELMGFEPAMMAAALDPDWVRGMAGYLADFWLELFGRVLRLVQPDFLFIWELICTNKGPVISPRMFRELFLPSYKKLIGGLKDCGVKNVWVDCQGNIWDMLPMFLEAGATGTLPLEVRGGMDVVEVRRRYPRLQMIGGIGRMALVRGKTEIDRELARVAPLVPQGGYIPSVDHYFSPDISWDNFRYFIEGLRRITYNGGRSVPAQP